MSKVFIEEATLADIGNAIREKESSTGLIPPLDMGDRIRAIAGVLAEINGYSYVCGTMSYKEDNVGGQYGQSIVVNHEDVGEVKAILIWCENITKEDVAYKALAFYLPSAVGTMRWFNSGTIYVSPSDGSLAHGNPANASAYGIYNDSRTQFSIGVGTATGARLLAGKTYHWIVIGGGVA